MMKKSVSLVEFSTTPTVSVMKTKTGENASSNENQQNAEQANSRVNAALAQLSSQQQQQGNNNNNNQQNNNQQTEEDGEGRGIFDLE